MRERIKAELTNAGLELDQRFEEVKDSHAKVKQQAQVYDQAFEKFIACADDEIKKKRQLSILEQIQKKYEKMNDNERKEAKASMPGRYDNLPARIQEARNQFLEAQQKREIAEKKSSQEKAQWDVQLIACKKKSAACRESYEKYNKISDAYFDELLKPVDPAKPKPVAFYDKKPPTPAVTPAIQTPAQPAAAQAIVQMENANNLLEKAHKVFENEVNHGMELLKKCKDPSLTPHERQSVEDQLSKQLVKANQALKDYLKLKPEAMKHVTGSPSPVEAKTPKIDESSTIVRRRGP